MYSAQKHIISKLQVDINTGNPQVAFNLKDNIDTFLKNEIFPYLEEYFSTVEKDLGTATVQIPYLALDVKTSSVLNYKELKEDVKRTLVEQIDKAIKKSSPQNEEARLITNEESVERGFLDFLETGSNPWWMTSGESYEVDEEVFETLLESSSFVHQLKRKLTNRSTQERSILQLSNHQLIQVVSKINPEISFLSKEIVFKNFHEIKSRDRLKLWTIVMDHTLQNDVEGLINRLIFLVTQKLSKVSKEEKVAKRKIDFNMVNIVYAILQSVTGIEKAKEAIHLIQENLGPELHEETTQAKEHNSQTQIENEINEFKNTIDPSIETKADHQNEEEVQKEQIESKQQKTITNDNSVTDDTELNLTQAEEENLIEADQHHIDQPVQELKEHKDSVEIESQQGSSIESSQMKKSAETEEVSKNEFKSKSKETLKKTKELKESLEELLEPQDQQLFEELESNRQVKLQQDNSGEYQVSNAGLIMLHPYLKDFFQYCDLLDENNQITDKEMAIHLLHYLATKQEQQYESNMLFEKVLCGVPIKEPIERNVQLSEKHKEMAEDLLEAVLTNWGVLKNASPDLLRNEFLQRLGKINFKEKNPKLTVERKVHDILLDKLPWNIGICRLPWLDHMLFTDW